MTNTFIDNRDAWLRMSEIDYLGQFVKTWLAFNAWYRSAYTEAQDRKIVNEIKHNSNPLANKIRPLLTGTSDDSAQLRAEIGLLHHRLENYEINEGKGEEKRRITLTNIFIKDAPPTKQSGDYYGYEYSVERLANGQLVSLVRRKHDNWVALNHSQNKFNLDDLVAQLDFQNNVPVSIKPRLQQLYQGCSPRVIKNLLEGGTSIECGAYTFRCERDELFAGVVEALYLMRCVLFHGELAPTKGAVECYEPAYRLVRRFLESVT